MIQIRDARVSEIERIRNIERTSASRFIPIGMPELAADEPASPEILAERAAAQQLLMAVDGEQSIGFLMFREVDGCAYIEQLDVLPSHARRRIGAALIDEAERRAREKGWPALLLSTFKDVPWNAPYYRRIGFEEIPDEALSPSLRSIKSEHEARGLDESRRVFMIRRVESDYLLHPG